MIKFIFSCLLSLVMVANSYAAAVNDNFSQQALKKAYDSINDLKSDQKSFIAKFKAVNPELGSSFEAWVLKHPEFNMKNMPKTKLENDSLSIEVSGQKIIYSLNEHKDIKIQVGSRSLIITPQMSFDEIEKQVNEKLLSSDTVTKTLMNLFIQDSYAAGLIDALLIIGIIGGLFYGICWQSASREEFYKSMSVPDGIAKACKDFKDETLNAEQLAAVKKAYEELKALILTKCKFYDEGISSACPLRTNAQYVKDCLKDKIEETEKNVVANGSRGQVKDVPPMPPLNKLAPAGTQAK